MKRKALVVFLLAAAAKWGLALALIALAAPK
jgi:hypothetical protein